MPTMKAILTYHSIDSSGSVVSVAPGRFREHMDLLVERRVPVLPLAELLSPSCVSGIALTFDDGFANFEAAAWPILRERGFPASVFVATDWVGRDNAWDPSDDRVPKLPLMGWPELVALAGEGLEIGSHTRSHPRLPALSDAELARELSESRAIVAERIGREPAALAYPYGEYDARVAMAAEVAGYTCALTTELLALDDTRAARFAVPRVDAYYLAKTGVMEMWGTGAFRRYLTFRRAARRARATLGRLAIRA
ncbi:MAG: polysaccharide deacetylase family protein [Gemmatimonadota bacterium]